MKNDIKKITVSAIMLALATVLSEIPIIQMPLGGSVTLLSMIPIVLISCCYGIGWGFGTAFVYSLVQLYLAISVGGLFTWGLTTPALVSAIIIDYILAFTVLGIAGIFAKRGALGILFGVILAVALRFVCHFISGAVIFDIWCEWSSPWLYSLCYNGLYMLPELVITSIGAFLLLKVKAFRRLLLAD